MTRDRWSELRWALTWWTSPAPLSWLLLVVLIYAIVDDITDTVMVRVALSSVRAAERRATRMSDSLQALIDSGLVVFYAPAQAARGHDTVAARARLQRPPPGGP